MADDSNTAQAEKLVAALREQVRDMSSKLVTVEREGIGSGTSRARALRIKRPSCTATWTTHDSCSNDWTAASRA